LPRAISYSERPCATEQTIIQWCSSCTNGGLFYPINVNSWHPLHSSFNYSLINNFTAKYYLLTGNVQLITVPNIANITNLEFINICMHSSQWPYFQTYSLNINILPN
jgi:hypothetical protein